MEVPRLGVGSELQLLAYATATADPSQICNLHHRLQQCRLLNPLSKARDWTFILMVTSWIHYSWATMGTPVHSILLRLFVFLKYPLRLLLFHFLFCLCGFFPEKEASSSLLPHQHHVRCLPQTAKPGRPFHTEARTSTSLVGLTKALFPSMAAWWWPGLWSSLRFSLVVSRKEGEGVVRRGGLSCSENRCSCGSFVMPTWTLFPVCKMFSLIFL